MSDYTRHLAESRGIIEARDVRPGDVILTRCPGDVMRNPHTVTTARVEPGRVTLSLDDGDTIEPSPGIPLTLFRLAESAELTAWQIGGAL